MKRPKLAGLTAYALLGLIAVLSMAIPRHLSIPRVAAAESPAPLRVTGVVRDFRRDHVDFGVLRSTRPGPSAGNVARRTGSDGRPVFVGRGFAVARPWRDASGNTIPPHLFIDNHDGGLSGGVLAIHDPPRIARDAVVDVYECSGTYDGRTPGPGPACAIGVPMPAITVPLDALPGTQRYARASGIHTIAEDLRCREMIVEDGARVQISGERVIVVDGTFRLEDLGAIRVLPGASLQLYVGGDFRIEREGLFNVNPPDPSVATVYCIGDGEMVIGDGSEVYASIVAPRTTLRIRGGAQVHGGYVGRGLDVQDDAGLHICAKRPDPVSVCGVETGDIAGLRGVPDRGGIHSAKSFSEWFSDAPGTNLATPHTLTLAASGPGAYEYATDAFHPIDDELWGNEGAAHNGLFTFAFEATFVYESCAGQFFEFEGQDDAWLFIDGNLALDLGGVATVTRQRIAVDRLGLDHGRRYPAQFFYAQRQPTSAIFRLRTNLFLETDFDRPLVGSTDRPGSAGG